MSVGEQLQRARQERKLSLAEVSQHTKIQPWVIEALEGDRLQELMSPIYVKGFLTTYARFLTLDPAALISQLRWPHAEPEQATLPPPQESVWTGWLQLWHLWAPQWRHVGAIAVVAAGVVGLFWLRPMPWVARMTSRAMVRTPTKAASLTSAATDAAPTLPDLPTMTLLASQPLELQVSASRTTWIQVRADGKLLTQQRLPRGAQERWTAKKRFELIVAKPSEVDLVLNGQPISPLAIANQGRLLITHHGVTRLPDDRR